MKTGDKAIITITGIAAGGDGVGRIDGAVVFVPGTCRGDVAEIQIEYVRSGCFYGRILRFLEASSHHRGDFCKNCDVCGGCNFAHMDYSEQLLVKKRIVEDAVQRIGGFSGFVVNETIKAPKNERYRNKMVFPLGVDKKGRPVGGFYAPGSHNLVPLSDCRQGDGAASGWLSAAVSFLGEFGISVYNEKTGKGLARRLFVRLAEATKEAMVVLTVNGNNLPHAEEFVEKLLAVKTEYKLTSVMLNIHKEANNLLLGSQNKLLFGRDYIEDILGGYSFRISAHSFYQVNSLQTERLYQTALDLAELSGHETVLDLYCGIGTISLFASRSAGRVVGVEVVPQAIENAKENAERNGVLNTEFILGKAEEVAPNLKKENPAVVFLDPPRKGADKKALEAIITMSPEKIVYISCNPATLARDLKFLCGEGYSLETVIPVDMFPNTSHVESVARLVRADSTAI